MKNYDLDKNEEWILSENLKQQEVQESSSDVKESNPKSDFGSYKMLKNGKSGSLIEFHNCMDEAAASYSGAVTQLMRRKMNTAQSFLLADVGCGAGFVANELKLMNPSAEVYAYDISSDGVEFGSENFPNVKFEQKSIDIGMDFGHKFSVIHAREFYPFSRTNSFEYHKDYLNTFVKNLAVNGFIIIGNIHNEKSLFNNYQELKVYLEQNDNVNVDRVVLPISKVFRIVPNLKIAGLITTFLNKLLNRQMSYLMTVTKK